ncbi:hypothetical protein [Azospirillum sp. ST 5-10]|uniref:hypothetical protein n=1 Tax=Azospirillum sp. ST 5-10 TaxID=3445776 RepID=UPI003F49FC1C
MDPAATAAYERAQASALVAAPAQERAQAAAAPAPSTGSNTNETEIEELRKKIKEKAAELAKDFTDKILDQGEPILKWWHETLRKMALDLVRTKFILPITQEIVEFVPELFGIELPAGAQGTKAGGGTQAQGASLFSEGGVGGVNTSLLNGTWLDRQLGGVFTDLNRWLDTPVIFSAPATAPVATATNGMLAGGEGSRIVAGAPGTGITPGRILGAAGYGFNAYSNFQSGNVVGGLGNTAAAIMSFIPGLQPFAPIAAIAGSILGGIFGGDPGPPTLEAATRYNSRGLIAADSGADNEADPEQAAQMQQTMVAAMETVLQASGGRFTEETYSRINARKGKFTYKIDDEWATEKYGSFDEAQIALYRDLVERGSVNVANEDVETALENTDATTLDDFVSDLNLAQTFRQTFDAMKDGYAVSEQIADMMAAAKTAGEQAKEQLVEWRDTAVRLGLESEETLNSVLEQQVEAMLGLGDAGDGLRGLERVTTQARINFEAFVPVLTELGVATSKQSELLSRVTQQAIDDYNAANDNVIRQGDIRVAQAVDPNFKIGATDTLLDLGLDASGFPALVAALDGFLAKADAGTATVQDLYAAQGELNQRQRNERISAEQYGAVLGMLIERYRDGAAAAQAMHDAEVEAGQAIVRSIDQTWQSLLQSARQTAQQTADAWDAAGETLGAYRRNLLLSDHTTLSPQEMFLEAQRQYRSTLAAAQGGDLDAAGRLQATIDAYLQANRSLYASANPAVMEEVQQGLASVESVAAQQSRAARDTVSRLDRLIGVTDDGMAAIEAALTATLAEGDFRDYGTNQALNRLIAQANPTFVGDFGAGAFDAFSQLWVSQHGIDLGANRDLNRVLAAATGFTGDFGTGAFDAYRRSNPLYDAIARMIIGYEEGGVVGTGLWGRDSVLARYADGGLIALAGGEHVMPADMTARYLPQLEAMRAGRYVAANDRWPGVADLRPPRGGAPVADAAADAAAGEVRRLRGDVGRLTQTVDRMARMLGDQGAEQIEVQRDIADAGRRMAAAGQRKVV